ncbi:MAG: tryptophan--tRNA ligase [Patescibacteria group bacterium]|jgi:tryptophanyl-tRNA synthetase
MKHIVLSGIKPSGKLHIGNYLGAIKSWLELQDEHECIFGIMDLHALTQGPKPEDLRQAVFDIAVDYLAAGLDPEKSIFMVQSFVPEHAELAWIFDTITPISWLERVPTYKDKSKQYAGSQNIGLLNYPVLMAADILLYKSNLVPVGEDQLPHIELTREIARTFNAKYGQFFPEPAHKLSRSGARIMSLTHPEKKMEKSLGEKNYIALSDTPEIIAKKLASAVTDSGTTGGKGKVPGVANLFALVHIFSSPETAETFEAAYRAKTIKYSEVKAKLAEDIAEYFEPFRKRRDELRKNPKHVWDVLREGSLRAKKIAEKNLNQIKKLVGLQ